MLQFCYNSITPPVICRSLATQGFANVKYVYSIQAASWVSCELLQAASCYKLGAGKLRAGPSFRRRSEIVRHNFFNVTLSRSCFRKIATTDFWPAKAPDTLDGIESIASCRKPFLRHRGKSGANSGKAGKKFFKKFFNT